MHQAQGTQALDQWQLAGGEVMEFLITVDQFGQLTEAFMTLAGQHHPQILYRRAHAAVVEVDHMEGIIAVQQVARVAVAVQANRRVAHAAEQFIQAREQIASDRLVGRQQAARHEAAVEQRGQGGVAKVVHSQAFAVCERTAGTDGVHASEQLAQAIQLVEIAWLRCPATATREQGEAKTAVLEQRLAIARQRRHHRDFVLGQLSAETVLLADRRIAPAIRTIKLGDQRRFAFDAHLIDAVLVAVECQYAGVAEIAKALHGIEHQIRGEGGKRMAHERLRVSGRPVYLADALAVGRVQPAVEMTGGCIRPVAL